jgi:hypothetical protein
LYLCSDEFFESKFLKIKDIIMPTIAMFYGMIVQLNKDLLEANWENVKCNVPVIKIEG